jgi:ribosome-associated protein
MAGARDKAGGAYLDTISMAKAAAEAADEKKARNIVTLEIAQLSTIADYFVICGAGSSVQAQAIADNIQEQMQKEGYRLRHIEGYRKANWILLDYGDVVAHVFQEEDRRFYNLEQLWSDAPVV